MDHVDSGVQAMSDVDLQDLALEAGRVFTPSAPIDERSLFAGRDGQIRLVVDAVNQKGQHAILFGERGVGKTSLANVLAEFLAHPDSEVIAPRITCDSQDTFDSVWRKVFNKVELQYNVATPGFTSLSPTRMSASAAQLLLPDNLEERITTDTVRRVLTALSHESIPIIIIDEFDILAEPTKKVLADAIKTLSDDAVRATIVLVGVADSVEELIKEHQSVERALVQVKMPRMSPDEIMAIIDRGLERLSMSIDSAPRRRIATLSRGLPHYTHLLSLYAARHAIDSKSLRITDDVVEVAIRKALDGTYQTTQQAWHLAIMSPRKDNLFAVVLLACALAKADELGYFAAQDVRGPLREITGRQYEISNFSQHLSEFCEAKRGFILQRISTKRRYRFRFRNPLMQPFIIIQGLRDELIKGELLDRIQGLWD